MRCENKKLISWMAVLNLILGVIPIAAAQGKDAVYSADHCVMSVTESPISMFGSDIDREPVGYCHDFSVCAEHHSCAPLQFSNGLATASAVSRRAILCGDTAIFILYSEIPEHPPKIDEFPAWKFSGCTSIERLPAREVFYFTFF